MSTYPSILDESPFAHFLIGFFVFLVLSCISPLCILQMKCLSKVSLANMFSHILAFPSYCADGFFCCAEAFLI